MFGIPAPTEFDLRFRLFGIPVRVNPFFWLFAALIGGSQADGTFLLLWVGCVFASILVHEFGHALTNRIFGSEPSVYLVMMGGLCVADPGRQRPWQRFLVILMGPMAGFLLAGLMFLAQIALASSPSGGSAHLNYVVGQLLFINIFWGVINLFPIMPLDGGQLAGILLTWHNRPQGMRRAYILSLVTAGLLAILCVRMGSIPNALLLGFLALSSFQGLQTLHYQAKFGDSFDDEADWWRR